MYKVPMLKDSVNNYKLLHKPSIILILILILIPHCFALSEAAVAVQRHVHSTLELPF